MAGLDNVLVDTSVGFVTLNQILSTLENAGLCKQHSVQLVAALKESKLYLQGEYLLHVKPVTSICAHHCRKLGLSDPKNPCFQAICDHEHRESCVSCELIYATLEL